MSLRNPGPKGVGRALFEAALARVDATREVRWVRLSVTVSNTTALRLYESLGFTRYGEEPESLFVGGKYYAEHHLVQLLRVAPSDYRGVTSFRWLS
jgi:ribosomal protein S18 acetylase RimI-like enzyme